ncbi:MULTISPECIES: NADH-quinone oxidoreductase subunit NuoG [unclassified Acidiphilium]|uniref:NADH-quinone oxidoreductase subunit NuoG n=1 Tax=unclassified Acidiphilium TaxID=2617493 RepID=UPI000BD0F678|nr:MULTISPECIES: NADH-quinone oxidoreductase subunit NuoG [unclassified Acidiphilium]OYV57513.1 MAG: NADH-quinone oxidoreductase subunit G [Acidiphilium sp. 20-67-58]HQT59611.1 NADH-quinone oxidoreductase subunit NuoG [Acidiphilium sp.]
MPKVTVDGVEIEVPNGYTVLQACEEAGKEIPRFCYHERLSIAGNCRMCLVEIEKMPKPVASCGQPVGEGMVIHTDNEKVRQARRGVMEFLLINHPLDCPICDQGGECDLQDEAVGYGRDHTRYDGNKRAVNDKYLGPLVKTVMTRCIHCTRCVRFMAEVAGVPELGAVQRGEHMEITNYVERGLSSELSGNIIDLCPVGALTSKPYAFTARTWELRKTDSIDVFDAVGTNIRIDSRGAEVLRVLPRLNDAVNEEWLADKGRFSIDGLKRRRLDRPWLREDGKLRPASWDEAFAAIAGRIKGTDGSRIGAIAGNLCDAESMMALKDLMGALGSANLDCRQDGALFDVSNPVFYRFNTTIEGIDEADALLIVGANPRQEAPVLNARLRRRWVETPGFVAGLIGAPADLTYDHEHLGEGGDALKALLDPEHPLTKRLAAAKRPMLIVGPQAFARADAASVLASCWQIARQTGMLSADWHGFNVLHNAASRMGALELGFLPGGKGKDIAGMMGGGVDVLWLLGADEFDVSQIGAETFVVYQGHHGDRGAARADVILPGAAYTEKPGTYVNTEGRAQRALRAIFPPGEAREDWAILRAASAALGRPLPYDDLDALRARMVEAHPALGEAGALRRLGHGGDAAPGGDPALVSDAPFGRAFANYYQTDPISRASPTMAKCIEEIVLPRQMAAE